MGLGIKGNDVYATLSGFPDGMVWGENGNLQRITFHVPNFSWFEGATVQDTASFDEATAARATVCAEGWVITIDSVSGCSRESCDKLEDASGNAITHVGKIERTNHSSFSISDGQELLDTLFLWLSFCQGNWVAPILSVGVGENDQPIWHDWRQWNFRRHERVGTWANRRTPEFLEQSFAGYYARSKNGTWGAALRRGLGWYIESNRGASGIESAIIVGQTALELLGWTYLVEDRKMMSPKGFLDIPASDKIRLLLANNQIPLEIPAYLQALDGLAKEYNWSDGPEGLVGMRNALVHPEPKNRKKMEKASSLAIYEARSLGLWYLDLLLLRLFNFSGVYHNRLKRECSYEETLEAVPWAP
jgi:hypothetical protein